MIPFLTLLASAALAQEAPVNPQVTSLIERVRSFRAAPPPLDERPTCLTGLVAELKEHRAQFSPEQWQEVALALDLPLSTPATPAPPLSDGTCVGNTGANSLVGDHFVVYWDNASQAEAEAMLEVLEYSWETIIDDLGWREPEGTPGVKLRFHISNQNYAGAYTTVEWCAGVGYVPYMVTGSGSFSAGSWYKTMGAHEFMHASQFSYGFAHEFYWWEASATWSEEYAYPSSNDWADMYQAFSYYPYIGMNASSQSDQAIFYHMYSMGIFATYLDEYWGGHDTVQDTWVQAASQSGTYSYWMPDVLEDMGLDFDQVWQGFMATTAFMDFRESNYYSDVRGVESYTTLPASGTEPNDAAESLGLNHFSFDEDLGEPGKYLQIDFSSPDAVDWNVVLVTGSGHTVYESVALEVIDGEGSAWIPFEGEHEAFLVVSPKDEDASGYNYEWTRADTWVYDWEACLVDSETGVPCGQGVPNPDDTGDTGDGADTPESPEPTGCGCASGALGGAPWLMGLLALARRRKR